MSRGAGCRRHVLVLPSVVCATRVAADIAAELGAVTITHQHGCSQVGDDGLRTRAAFEQIACNPNVAGVLVVGLGCETNQGSSLASGIEERGQRVEFIGIQEQGGSRGAVARGVEVGGGLLADAARELVPPTPARTVIGIEASHASPLLVALTERALDHGAAVVVSDSGSGSYATPDGASEHPAYVHLEHPSGVIMLSGTGHGAQQHVALAAAGADLIVSFPGLDDAPVGFSICPVIAVGGPSPLHAALGDDFDLAHDASADELWATALAVLGGAQTAAELRSSRVFALERLAMSM